MRLLFAALGVVVIVICAGYARFLQTQQAALPDVTVTMGSDPFPMAVGPNEVLVALEDRQGAPINDAVVEMRGVLVTTDGQIPMSRTVTGGSEGVYRIPVTWPMRGQWLVDVGALIPGREQAVAEQFTVYVYPVPQSPLGERFTYRSRSEDLAFPYDEARDLLIVIPLGTFAEITAGHGENVIPPELVLSVSGRNTIIIRNDDIADHEIGPFFVRAGETIRQTFTEEAVYVGACSVRHDAAISIYIDA